MLFVILCIIKRIFKIAIYMNYKCTNSFNYVSHFLYFFFFRFSPKNQYVSRDGTPYVNLETQQPIVIYFRQCYHASSSILESLEPLASDIHDTKKHYDQVLMFRTKIRFCHTLAIQTFCTDKHPSNTLRVIRPIIRTIINLQT